MTKIEWTDKVWNPVTGCDAVSPGCDNCYAKVMAKRLKAMGLLKYNNEFDVTIHYDELDKFFGWKPKRIFVNSMSDLFHHDIPNEFIQSMFNTIRVPRHEQHIFQILTKRPERAKKFFSAYFNHNEIKTNVWLGVSAENQKYADKRIPQLLQIPAAKRFVSCEPLLDEITMRWASWHDFNDRTVPSHDHLDGLRDLDWIIIGCESGPNRRPCKLDWVYSLVDQCQNAQVPVFVKQINLDGKVVKGIDKFPKDLQIQEFPKC